MPRSNVRRGAASAVAAAGVFALGLGVAAPANATLDETTGAVTVDLLSITDLHGALVQTPNIAQQVASFTAANEDTVFSAVGDSIGGSTFESAVDGDLPTLETLVESGVDVSAVGNHEFDKGYPDLRDRVQPAIDFPYLGANVVDEVTGEPVLDPYEIITTENGVRIGYVGTVTDTTPTIVSQSGIEGLRFEEPVAATNEYAALLSDGIDTPENPEADVVVALIHEGTEVVQAGIGEDVDVVFTGHSHNPRLAETPSGAPIVQSEASGSLLGHVQLTVAVDGTITYGTVENLPVQEYTWDPAVPEEEQVPGAAFDAEVAETVRLAFERAEELGSEEVGTVGAPFNAASNAGTGNTGTPQHRGAESPVGNLIAEIAYETVNDFGLEADFGIVNPGGIRADLDADRDGIVTFREAFNVTSFGNTIGTVDITGAQVVTMLEQQFEARPPRPMLALGLSPQLSYLYDPTAPIGSRVIAVYLNDAPIDPAATYRVASNTFLLEGNDGFTVLGEGTNLQESGVIDWQATADYLGLAENAGLTPTYEQQSIGVSVATDLTQAIAPGEEVTVELSSLSFTSTEPKAETVTAYVVGSNLPSLPRTDAATTAADLVQPAAEPGTVLAEVAVDNANVVDSNETGRATVTFTVPEDTVDGQLQVAFVASGAEVPDTTPVVLEFTVAAAAEPTPEPTNPTPTAPAPTDPPVDGGDDQAGPGEGTLPETGAELAGPLAIVAMLVLLAGLGLVLRRRVV